MDIPIDKVREAILFLIALILSISVHEFGHAWMANRLGDPLPKAQGRLTLSPARHIDPIGTIVFPLLMQFTAVPLFGWGRPVETNPLNYSRRFSVATGNLLVSVAGPFMNLLMATVVSLIVVVAGRAGVMPSALAIPLIEHLVQLNLFLMFFNLLPIPPLDGGAVLAWALPRSMQGVVHFLSRWGMLILLGLLIAPSLGLPGLGTIMRPAASVVGFWIGAVLEGAGLLGGAPL